MTSQYSNEISETPAEDTMTSQNANEISGTQAEAATSSTSANNASSSNAFIYEHGVQGYRPLIETTPRRKRQVYNWSHNKKLCKLAKYSACEIPECSCVGWKWMGGLPSDFIIFDNPDNILAREPLANFTDPCRTCNHQLEDHVIQLQGESVDEINRLLGIVVDIESLYISMRSETNIFQKRSYFYLFKALDRCVQNRSSIRVPGPLGPTPFERPTVAKAIANFMLYKYNEVEDSEWQTLLEVAQMFLNCLNDLNLQAPDERQMELSADDPTNPVDVSVYVKNYIRWFVASFVPLYCDSLPRYAPALVFGRTLLRDVYGRVARRLVDACRAARLPAYKRALYRRHVPQFLALFEVETFSNHSPIWNTQFHQLVDYENDMIEELHRLIPPR